MKKNREYCTAYFVSNIGNIVPILQGTHIRQIIAEPATFGLTMDVIRRVHAKFGEELGTEKCARNEIIKGLLQKEWTRVRIDGNSYINCQISFESKRIYKNIMRLLAHIRLVRNGREFRALGLRVYIQSDRWLVNAYDTSEAKKMLVEKITDTTKRKAGLK